VNTISKPAPIGIPKSKCSHQTSLYRPCKLDFATSVRHASTRIHDCSFLSRPSLQIGIGSRKTIHLTTSHVVSLSDLVHHSGNVGHFVACSRRVCSCRRRASCLVHLSDTSRSIILAHCRHSPSVRHLVCRCPDAHMTRNRNISKFSFSRGA
jgi:hypothetical protein